MILDMELMSKELKKHTQVKVILPGDRDGEEPPYKTLWLLHGRTDDHTAWMRNTLIHRYAREYNLAVIMPNADKSWYTNTAYEMNYFDYITKELPELCRRSFRTLSEKREDNIIAGLSMGGYGALKAALTYPEQYGACISLSGAIDVTRKGRPSYINEWRSIFGFDIESPLELEGSEHDLFALASKRKEEDKEIPRIYMWCGLEDSLLGANRLLDEHLTKLGTEHIYEESEGNHSWKWWDIHIQDGLRWVFGDK